MCILRELPNLQIYKDSKVRYIKEYFEILAPQKDKIPRTEFCFILGSLKQKNVDKIKENKYIPISIKLRKLFNTL